MCFVEIVKLHKRPMPNNTHVRISLNIFMKAVCVGDVCNLKFLVTRIFQPCKRAWYFAVVPFFIRFLLPSLFKVLSNSLFEWSVLSSDRWLNVDLRWLGECLLALPQKGSLCGWDLSSEVQSNPHLSNRIVYFA